MRIPLLATLAVLVLTLPALPGGPAGTVDASIITPAFDTHVAPSTLFFADSAAEPTIGVNWNTGAVMYQSYADTYRVTFSGTSATWTDVSSPYSLFNIDPILFTDPASGRTFAGGLSGACSALSYSDNDGASWTPMGNPCAGGGVDHPTIGSGPWAGGQPVNALYNRSLYYCAQTSIAQCSVSSDGGLTFGPTVPIQCGYLNPGLHGSVHVGPNGIAFLPFKNCGTVNGVAVSVNNGVSWVGKPIPGATSAANGFDPDVATTRSGWVYVAYPTSGNGVGVALTKNNGTTWTNFGDVAAAAGIRSATFHEMVAGDDDRAAVAYLGSTTDGNPHAASFNGVWRLYVSYTYDAGATWTTVQTSTNIVQKGWVCADGTGCSTGRNLLDFIDAQVTRDGRVVVGYADGCISTCETGSGPSNANWATLARQSSGTGLFR